MTRYETRTQAELDAALDEARPGDLVVVLGDGWFRVEGSAHVEARGSAHVEAWESAHVTARGSAHVEASEYVSITVDRRDQATRPQITGGVLIEVPPITTAAEWCDYHGVGVVEGLATLYKGVDDDYATAKSRSAGIFYLPGTSPEAPDWDPLPECGGGLHFSPHPAMTKAFNSSATRFVACPVRLDEIVVHNPADWPDKVKAPRVAGPIVEVDERGAPIAVPKPKRSRKAAAA